MNAIVVWLAMGGYAEYVWPAYAVAALVLGGLAFHASYRHRASARELARLQRQHGKGE